MVWTTPKTFVGGERLYASDLNTYVSDNLSDLDTRVQNAGPSFSTAASNTVNIDFSSDKIITRSADGNLTFTASNYTAGKSAVTRIVCDGTDRDLTFPTNWVWASVKPTEILANETGILTATSFGTTESDVVAAWAWSA